MKLCLSTFFAAIKKCVVPNGFVQEHVLAEFFLLIWSEKELSTDQINHIVRGDKNPPLKLQRSISEKDSTKYCEYTDCMEIITKYVDSGKKELLVRIINRIIKEDDSIDNNTVVEKISGITKKELSHDIDSLDTFLGGIFLFIITETDNKGTNTFVKQINDDYLLAIKAEMANPIFDETTEIQARGFLQKYESDMGLFPICQVAYAFKPNHRHIRDMYNEYCRFPKNVRRYILKQGDDEKFVEVSDLHYGAAISIFCDYLDIYKRSSPDNHYLFTEKMHKAFYYHSEASTIHMDILSFPNLCPPTGSFAFDRFRPISLETFIDDYLWLQENGKTNSIPMPFDYLYSVVDMGHCPELV